MKAMVMAAGAGTRLRPLTFSVPKPMVPIANRPVLEYTLENLRRHGITELMLNLHSHPEMIRKHFKNGADWGVHIRYSHEPRLMGTAGGVKKVASFLKGGTFLVMSGDGLTDVNLASLVDFHQRRRAVGTLALKPLDIRFEYGVTLTSSQGRITRFIEKPNWSDVFSNQVNTGIYVLEPSVLGQIPAKKEYDFGHQLLPKLLQKKQPLFGRVIDNYWCDVGSLREYRQAQRDVLDGKIRLSFPGRLRRPGVWIDEGAVIDRTARLEAPCLIGKNTRIGPGVRIGAYTIIGEDCRIAARATVRNSILWNRVRIASQVTLENCILGHDARITEGISLYEGAVINPR